MNRIAGLLFSAALLAIFSGCAEHKAMDSMDMKGNGSMSTTAPSSSSMSMVYTCTMHPEVISDKPGKCPKCGMDLVVKK